MHFTFIYHFIFYLSFSSIYHVLECISGTNLNINENIALHAYLFIPLLRTKEKMRKIVA